MRARLTKAARGLLGDVQPVGGGVCEMREHFGAGLRRCDVPRGRVLIVMLGGGLKATRAADIHGARALAAEIEE